MGGMFQETVSSQLGVLEEGFQLEDRLSQVRQGRESRRVVAPLSVPCFRVLYRVWHRTHSSCTADEAWTKLVTDTFCVYCLIRHSSLRRYLVLNRNGTASQIECTSRSFNPVAMFNELKFVHIPRSLS